MQQPRHRRPSITGNSQPRFGSEAYHRSLASLIARRALPPAMTMAGLFLAGAGHAATITVDSSSPLVGAVAVDNSDGLCSLTEAVTAANNNASSGGAPGECDAGSGSDTIILPRAAVFSFTSANDNMQGASALPSITSPIIIQGNDATIARASGAATAFRLIRVEASGDLDLDRVTLEGGQAQINGDDYSSNGGGILSFGELTITDSTVRGNTSGADGGGIFHSFANLSINRSTVSGNSAGDDGGGVRSNTNQSDELAQITNSTISGNTAADHGGGVYNRDGRLFLTHVTVTANSATNDGAGMSSRGDGNTTSRLAATIVSGNTGSNDLSLVVDTTNSFTSYGYNVIGGVDAGIDSFSGAFDLDNVADSGLGPLQDNGGAASTHLPAEGSVVRDRATADPTCAGNVSDDQRGVSRQVSGGGDGACDAGAVERVAPIIVDGNDVAVSDNGSCSLLEAIVNANVTGTHADCEAGSDTGPDSIVLESGTVFGLTEDFGDSYGPTGLPEIRSEILIQGNGAIIERSSAAEVDFRVLAVDATGDLTLDQATLRGGVATGNILQDKGGGFRNSGSLTLRRVTVTGNTGRYGGGGYVDTGLLQLERSTISGNSAEDQAGGLQVRVNGTARLSNSTVSGNSAPFVGGIVTVGSLGLTHSTIAGNTDISLANAYSGATTLTNSLVVGGPCYGAGANTLIGANIASDGSCSGFTEDPDAASLLGPLADNGGPTQTHALQAGHPAIDVGAADAHCAATDQRGAARPQDGDDDGTTACDVGAVESIDPIEVQGACTLSQAINNANDTTDGLANTDCPAGSPAGPDIIALPTDAVFTYTLPDNTVEGANALPSITSEIVIAGNRATVRRSSGLAAFRLFHVENTGNLTLNELTVQGGLADGDGNGRLGGAIFNRGTTTLTNSTVSGNSADSSGGGIFSFSSITTLTNSTVSGNSAGADGGGIRSNSGGTTTLTNSTVSGNSAGDDGGGINSFSSITTHTNSTVSGNSAGDDGGGIYSGGGTTTHTNSTVSGNSAGADGGGIFSLSTTTTLTNSTVSGNSADGDGGAIFGLNATTTLTNSLIAGNTSPRGAELANQSGTFNTTGINLFGHAGLTNAQAFFDFTPGPSDITATNGSAQATALGNILVPLAVNDGPTRTHGLPPTSPAVDAIDCGVSPDPATDQRGISRPQPGSGTSVMTTPNCDIGAVETRDFDEDGLPNGYEDNNGLDSNSADGNNGAGGNPDGDALNNTEEFFNGSSASDPDSDDDGLGDGIDAAPRTVSNTCVPDFMGNVLFGNSPLVVVNAGTLVQCAAPGQIRVNGDLTINADGRVELFSDTVNFQTGVSVPVGGQLRVRIGNPVPGASPPP